MVLRDLGCFPLAALLAKMDGAPLPRVASRQSTAGVRRLSKEESR
jgi:hypothetical protein